MTPEWKAEADITIKRLLEVLGQDELVVTPGARKKKSKPKYTPSSGEDDEDDLVAYTKAQKPKKTGKTTSGKVKPHKSGKAKEDEEKQEEEQSWWEEEGELSESEYKEETKRTTAKKKQGKVESERGPEVPKAVVRSETEVRSASEAPRRTDMETEVRSASEAPRRTDMEKELTDLKSLVTTLLKRLDSQKDVEATPTTKGRTSNERSMRSENESSDNESIRRPRKGKGKQKKKRVEKSPSSRSTSASASPVKPKHQSTPPSHRHDSRVYSRSALEREVAKVKKTMRKKFRSAIRREYMEDACQSD